MNSIYNIFVVFIGSGLGGVTRWALSQCLNGKYPLGTLAVNVIGCFLIGLLSKHLGGDSAMKLLMVTGFCGGFTTFSTFINENFLLLRGEQLLLSLGYVVVSLVLGLLACLVGWKV